MNKEIGKVMAEARKRQDLTQKDVSIETNYSRESIAKYETGGRKLPKELYPKVTQCIDDPQFYFDSWGLTTGHVSIPFLNGDYIDRHPAAMKELVTIETNEALENLTEICWFKSTQSYSDAERNQIENAMFEVLDAGASMFNLVATLSKEHSISMSEVFRKWQLSLKVRKLKK